jgi:hypothetical protein
MLAMLASDWKDLDLEWKKKDKQVPQQWKAKGGEDTLPTHHSDQIL